MTFYRLFLVFILGSLNQTLIAEKPLRVISLAPSLTKNIYYLNAQSQLVGCTNYCTEALADHKEIVASAIKVNLEKTVSLLPDLVLVTTITSPKTIKAIKNFGIQVEVFSTPKNFGEICDQFIRIGKLMGSMEQAQKIVDETAHKVDSISKSFIKKSTPNVLIQIGADPLFTVLPHTFMNDYITLNGSQNIAGDMKAGTLTREYVLMKNPDYIFIVTMGMIGEEEKVEWKSFTDLKAAKNKNIYIIDAEKACSPTPITFTETLETITTLMNQKP